MFSTYDVVRSTRRLSDEVPEDSIGTVLIVYDVMPPAYEVEFVDEARNTIGILTVSGLDIRMCDEVRKQSS